MAETDYVTLDELKSFLRIRGVERDEDLSLAITAASRSIEEHTRRPSFLAAPATAGGDDTSRVYPVQGFSDWLTIAAVVNDADLVVKLDRGADGTFEETWTEGTEFDAYPLNHVADGWPVLEIRCRRGWTIPSSYGSSPVVQVTGNHGWPSVPPQIHRAAMIWSARLYRRGYSPDGLVEGFDRPARVPYRIDPDVEMLLAPFVSDPVRV